MKKIFAIMIAAAMAMPEVLAIQSGESTQGSEFYFSFMRGRPKREKTMTLFVSSEVEGKLELTNPRTGTTVTHNINVGKTEIALASTNSAEETSVTVSGTHKDCYTVKSNVPDDNGYYAHATNASGEDIKVSLYASLSGSKTADAACVYPIEALGNEYYVISRSGNSQKNSTDANNFPSEALIVATDDCDIEIYPTCLLDNDATAVVPEKIEISLSRGQTYLIRAKSAEKKYSTDGATGTNDLTGTRIVLKNDGVKGGNMCKKIAVFAGTQHGSGQNSAYNNGDYEFDQLFPTHLWGSTYIVGSPDAHGSAVTRIVASKPCTKVSVNGVEVATLNPSQFYEYVDTENKGCYVHATKPVGVAFFTTGQNTGDNADGAPAMITIAPAEQAVQDMTFTAIANGGISEHSLMITAKTSACNSTTLTNSYGTTEELNSGWTVVPGTEYSYRVYSGLNTGASYTLKNPNGFNAYVYGSKGKDVGYGYSVGSAAVTNTTNFSLNGIEADEITMAMCIDPATKFKPTDDLDNIGVSEVRWVIDKATPVKGAGDNYTYIIGENVYNEVLTDKPYEYTANLAPNFYHAKMVVYKTPATGVDACYVNNVGNKDSVETYFFVKDNKGGLDSLLTVCAGSTITLPSHSVGFGFEDGDGAASLNHYVWLASQDGVNFTDTLSNTTSPKPFDTSALRAGVVDSVFIMSSYNDKNHCSVYQDTIRVSIPAELKSTLTLDGDGKLNDELTEIRFCNDGGKNVTVTPKYEFEPAVSVPKVAVSETLTNSGADVTAQISGGVYSYSPNKSDEIVYSVSVKDEFGKVCHSLSKTVNVIATPKFETSLMAHDYVKNIDGNPITLRMTGGELDLTATNSPASSTVYTYRWFRKNTATAMDSTDISNGRYDEGVKSLGVVESKGRYVVTVADADSLCFSQAYLDVFMDELRLPSMVVPNEVTESFGDRTLPEEGASGEQASVQSILGDYTLYIFDRYGRKVAEERNRGWQADDMRKEDAGVYFYVIESKRADGEKDRIRGTVEIIKR